MVELKGWEKIFGAEKTPSQPLPSTEERVRELHIVVEGVKTLQSWCSGVNATAMYDEMLGEVAEELHELGVTPGG